MRQSQKEVWVTKLLEGECLSYDEALKLGIRNQDMIMTGDNMSTHAKLRPPTIRK